MNEREIEKEIEVAVRANVEKFVSTLDQRIENALNSALLSLLGIENRYAGRYEIDHCNGRNSVFIDVLRDKAKAQVEALITKIGPLVEGQSKELHDAIRKEYANQLQYEVRTASKNRATNKANEVTDKILARVLQKNGFPKPEKKY